MKKRSFISQIWLRLKGDTPSFFGKIRNVGIGITGLATGLTTIPNVPEKITSVTGDLIWVGAVMTLVASLVVKDGNKVTYKDKSDQDKVNNAVIVNEVGK